LKQWSDLKAIISEYEAVCVFLTFEGTLIDYTGEVDGAFDPAYGWAPANEHYKDHLKQLAIRYPTALLTGFGRNKALEVCKIPELFYAGCHGFDLPPKESEVRNNESSNVANRMTDGSTGGAETDDIEENSGALGQALGRLRRLLENMKGTEVEMTALEVRVSYHAVEDQNVAEVEGAIAKVLEALPMLRSIEAHREFVLRQELEWHKGKAVEWLLDTHFHPALSCAHDAKDQEIGAFHKYWPCVKEDPVVLNSQLKVLPISIGPAVSNEDAFRAVRDRGGICMCVGDSVVTTDSTVAQYWLQGPDEVAELIKHFLDMDFDLSASDATDSIQVRQ